MDNDNNAMRYTGDGFSPQPLPPELEPTDEALTWDMEYPNNRVGCYEYLLLFGLIPLLFLGKFTPWHSAQEAGFIQS